MIKQMKRILNFRAIFYSFLFFLFGTFVARKLFAGNILTICLIVCVFATLFAVLIARNKIKIGLILIVFFLLGNGSYFVGTSLYYVKDYQNIVSVVGHVSDNFTEDDSSYKFVLDNVYVDGEKSKNISVYLSKNLENEIKIGEILCFSTKINKIRLFQDDNFNSYYYRQNIGYSVSELSSNVVAVDGYRNFDENIRISIKDKLYQNMSEENAGVCYALLFGDKSGVDLQVKDYFKNTGTIHVLTVSGLHVSFLIFLLYGFLKLCHANRYVNLVLTSIIIFFYAYLCGFSPSVLRASIMGFIFLLSKAIGRRYDTLTSLGIAGFAICLINPLSPLDTGFLMSVGAVVGISFLFKPLLKLFLKLIPFKAASALALSVAVELTILPLILIFNSSFNLLSPFANLLVVPLVGIIYPILFCISFISLILPFFAVFFKFIQLFVAFLVIIVKFFASTNLILTLTKMPLQVALIFFFALFVLSKYFMTSKRNKAFFSCLCIFVVCLFMLFVI